MPPKVEVYSEETNTVFASVEVDPAAPKNTVDHIGIKLLELVHMGQARNPDRKNLNLLVAYDRQWANQTASEDLELA